MDGFDSSKGIFILGATNRPEILDKALLRPGRFDRRIIVDKPDLKGREEILNVHAKNVKMDETVDLKGIALATSGAVGSDLANMINEAAINAVKGRREYVSQQDLMEAVEQVLVGKEKKDRILSKEERKIVSYHEIGHAIISAVQKNTEPVQKITIVPRTMGALGYVMQVPEDEKYLQTKDELYEEIIELLGGRAAEEVIFNTVTTGASNDIEKATSIARAMITMYGMSDKFGLVQLETVQNRYLDGNRQLNCSEVTEAEIDKEVMLLLDKCYEESKRIIREHLDTMDKLAQFLIEKETITGKEFMRIYREAENIPEPTEEELKNKTGRIYATRPESAIVGENVPVKEPKKEQDNDQNQAMQNQNMQQDQFQQPQQPQQNQNPYQQYMNPQQPIGGGINWNEPIFDPNKVNPPQNDAQNNQGAGQNFDAEINDAQVRYHNSENDGSENTANGGRFSHVPDNFDDNNNDNKDNQ